jgi:hypothetical protein
MVGENVPQAPGTDGVPVNSTWSLATGAGLVAPMPRIPALPGMITDPVIEEVAAPLAVTVAGLAVMVTVGVTMAGDAVWSTTAVPVAPNWDSVAFTVQKPAVVAL